MLAAHLAEFGAGEGGLIFTSSTGKPIARTNWRPPTGVPAAAAGVEGRTRTHDLRHVRGELVDRLRAVGRRRPGGPRTRHGCRDVDGLHHLWPTDEDLTRGAIEAASAGWLNDAARRACVTQRVIADSSVHKSPGRGLVTVSRPVSGILCSASRRRWPSICAAYPRGAPANGRTGRPCPLLGLAPGGVCRAARVAPDAGALLPHRFTLTCGRSPGPSAVCSLLHFPSGRPDLALASTLPCGVPTFLDTVTECRAAATRPTHRRPSG